jgi:tetratricopeptide (TPR) repeat protein
LAEAATEVEQFLKQNPASGQAYDLLGQIKIAQRLLTQAEECFRKAIQVSPRRAEAYEDLAFLQLLRRRNGAAGAVAQKLLQLDPGSYNARLIAGLTSYNQGLFRDSLRYLLPLVEGNGGRDPLALAVAAEACKRVGRDQQAGRLTAESKQLKVLPKDAILGARLLNAAEFRPLVTQWLVNAEEQGVDSFELYYQLGSIYFQDSQPAPARQYLLYALARKPSDVATLVRLASVEEQLGDQQASLEHFLQAKRAPKTDYSTLIFYAQACIRRRMFIDARQTLEEAVSKQPEDEAGHYLLGVSAYGLQNYALAETELRTALARQPVYSAARLALGVVLLARGRIDEADDEFRAVISADLSSGAAHYYLAQVYRRRGKAVEARAELEAAIHLGPDDARPYADLAGLEISEDRLAQANDLLKRALTLDPQSSKAHYERGVLFQKQGKLAQAKEEFDLSRKLNEEEAKNAVVLLVTKGSTDYELTLPPSR